MIKFRLYLDKDEETKWLNEMADQGWAMKRFLAGFYSFEKCEPGRYIYQVDFGTVSKEYREFMESVGVELVQTWGFWVFLRKLSLEGQFELYTDVDSSIEHYTKILKMFKVAAIVELICLLIELFMGFRGAYMGYALALLLSAVLAALVNAIIRTKNVIAELRDKKGETSPKYKRDISPLLICGLLVNACALAIDEAVSEPVQMTVQIIAIALMLVGIYQTAGKKNKR